VAEPRALIIDWGGVLTTSLRDTMTAWCEADDLDYRAFRGSLKDWLVDDAGDEVADNPIHALERGEVATADFERDLAARLQTRSGGQVEAAGLLDRMFSGFIAVPQVVAALRRVKAAGIATALLSNSWGNEYPREGWEEMFDVVVISGEVNMRKPEPRIYQHTVDLLGLEPRQCVFVDDLRPNIAAAEALGMTGILHVTPAETIASLEQLFGLSLDV
jgi:putative hydrolase of the HAD superfamily